ncbi:alpha/beta hydrolase [Sphingomonadaceae bacterium OTU29MARTA1]|nr:alpha/beta hydrolase [Sphingomonadaceae bacterium OTU29MARTA1]
MTDRRTLIAGGLAALLPLRVSAQATAERFPLWPKAAPGGEGRAIADQWVKRSPTGGADDIAWPHVATPMLTVVRPTKPNGAAVLICPGGGYARVAVGRTAGGIARDFANRGFTAFEMLYRLPHDGWAAGPDVALQDAQRAIRVIRAGAQRFGIDPAKVAVTGFSAGGHVAARLGARASVRVYDPVDAADTLSARPDVAGLFFPVVTMLDDGVHAQSRRELLGTHAAGADWQRRYSAQIDLPADMPPTFVAANADDPVVPARNAVLMYEALKAAKTPAELMIFERGGHGPPAPYRNGKAVPWMDLFVDWAGDHGWA